MRDIIRPALHLSAYVIKKMDDPYLKRRHLVTNVSDYQYQKYRQEMIEELT